MPVLCVGTIKSLMEGFYNKMILSMKYVISVNIVKVTNDYKMSTFGTDHIFYMHGGIRVLFERNNHYLEM